MNLRNLHFGGRSWVKRTVAVVQFAFMAAIVLQAGCVPIAPTPPATGGVTWVWSGDPSGYPSSIRDEIESSMNAAVDFYNENSSLVRELNVRYDPGVPTAQANIDGRISFGGQRNERVALHEIAHTFGVGTTRAWGENRDGNTWTGPVGIALLESYDGVGTRLNADAYHFWPYGLNYDREDSPTNRVRHVKLVQAMVCDMGSTEFRPSC